MLAWVNGDAVGTARYRLDPDALYVGRVSVLPAFRQQGIGTAIMLYAETLAREFGRNRVRVGVRMSLPQNLTFYQHLGYSVVDIADHPRGPDRVAALVKEVDGGDSL